MAEASATVATPVIEALEAVTETPGTVTTSFSPPFAHDGTERRIVCPQDAAEQADDYSGKKKDHTVTNVLLVNARLVPSVDAYRTLKQLLEGLETKAVYHSQTLAAAMIGPRGPAPPPDDQIDHWNKYLRNSVIDQLPTLPLGEGRSGLPLFDYPHDLIRRNLEQFGESLNHRLSTGPYQEIAAGVFAVR